MYDRSTGKNCVATIKLVDVGSETYVAAVLRVQGGGTRVDDGRNEYYAATEGKARDTCVAYEGTVHDDGRPVSAGRQDRGNCG